MTARGLLTRHFFGALFDFGVFTQDGADAFVRVIVGLFSLIVSVGLLIVRMYGQKYAVLSAAATGAPYARAFAADMTLAIALPMWVVALATVLVSHSLFPDETDFRVLTPLPIARRVVFGTKLAALLLFCGSFAVTTQVAATPLVLRIAGNRWATDTPVVNLLSFWVTGLVAAAFALLAVVAINGLVITCIPRRRAHAIAAAARSAMLGGLVLAMPLVMALPAQEGRIAQHSRLMLAAPPAWFMGVERVLAGHRDPYVVELASVAVYAFVVAAAIAAGSYIITYRRFGRVMLRRFDVSGRHTRRVFTVGNPVRAAVVDFTAATLRRSALHQGVLIGLALCGVALAVNNLLRSGIVIWLQGVHPRPRDVFFAATEIPFPLIILMGIAARASLALPIEPKANWIFRMTEREAIRADELHAAERIVLLSAAAVPTALTLPLQWAVAGPRALVAASMTAAFGCLWSEALLRDWRRIPFTCSYMPGKHSVAQSSLIGGAGYLMISLLGSALEAASLRGTAPKFALITIVLLAAGVLMLRRLRLNTWRETPLAFDDELPSDVQVFGLSGG